MASYFLSAMPGHARPSRPLLKVLGLGGAYSCALRGGSNSWTPLPGSSPERPRLPASALPMLTHLPQCLLTHPSSPIFQDPPQKVASSGKLSLTPSWKCFLPPAAPRGQSTLLRLEEAPPSRGSLGLGPEACPVGPYLSGWEEEKAMVGLGGWEFSM